MEQLKTDIKNEVDKNMYEGLRSIFNRMTRNHPQGHRVTFKEMCPTMTHRREKHLPKAPLNVDDFHEKIMQNEELRKHYKGFVEVDGEKIAVVFGSNLLIVELEGSDLVFYDGTFFVVPKIFKQMFSISFKADGHHNITLYVLMISKSYLHYLAVFNFVKNLIPNWNPTVSFLKIYVCTR